MVELCFVLACNFDYRVIKTFSRELIENKDDNVVHALRVCIMPALPKRFACSSHFPAQILQSLVVKERATAEIVNSGCVGALLMCLNNIKKAEKSSVCIFECLRTIMKQEVVKRDFTRNDGVVAVARHLVDLLGLLSAPYAAADEEVYVSAANHCVCTFLELCNIDLARDQFANIGLHQFLREFTAVPQIGKTARLHTNTGDGVALDNPQHYGTISLLVILDLQHCC